MRRPEAPRARWRIVALLAVGGCSSAYVLELPATHPARPDAGAPRVIPVFSPFEIAPAPSSPAADEPMPSASDHGGMQGGMHGEMDDAMDDRTRGDTRGEIQDAVHAEDGATHGPMHIEQDTVDGAP